MFFEYFLFAQNMSVHGRLGYNNGCRDFKTITKSTIPYVKTKSWIYLFDSCSKTFLMCIHKIHGNSVETKTSSLDFCIENYICKECYYTTFLNVSLE